MHLDAYPLSPIQLGMLFHWLLDPRSGTDVEQIVGELDEPIDVARFRAAWQRVVDAVPVLRTSFEWDEESAPRQRIVAACELPFRFDDLTALDSAAADSAVLAYLESDRTDGFDLGNAPAMRVAVFRLGPTRHLMVWTFHHILIDGRSFETLLNDVFAVYEDPGNALAHAAAARPYREYAEWVSRQDPAAARAFWRDKLQGFTAPTPLPGGHPVRLAQSRFGESEVHLSADATQRLRDLASREDLSLNTLVMSAWALLLARYSGEAEVVFGATKTTRRGSIPDADAMVGLFLATIPVRIPVDQDLRAGEWLRRVRAEWVSLRGREHLPLVDIKSASDVPASAPLFETLVVFENYQFGTRLNAQGGPWARRHFRIREQTNFPLTLLAYGDDRLAIKIDYDARRFDRSAIDRLIGQLTVILESWATDTSAPLWATPMLPEAERRIVLDDWNATAASYPLDVPLAELVEAQVAAAPDRPAVIFGERILTYADLNARANRLAHVLIGDGVGPNAVVGVCVERSVELMVALLAVAKTGGAWVPLDPALPIERLAHMQRDSGMRTLVTQQHLVGRVGAAGLPVHLVDGDEMAGASDQNPHVGVAPSDLAYILYTSGSTGVPKGVQIPRGALANLLASMQQWLGLTSRDVLLNVTTISFDIAEVDVWLPWLVGATTVIASRDAAADGEQLARLLSQHEVTFLQATPVTWRALLEAGWAGSGELQVVCTGEAMPPAIAPQLVARAKRVWNLYGPTETTIWSTGYEVRDPNAPILIGRPIANTTTYVLDAHRQPVPIGVTGELYIGGAGVADGYRNRPELTAERFLPDPFRPGERVYRTGDLARYHEDGNLECLGRTDHQVKLRGFRIELGEIESALQAQAGVAQAVVVAREDAPGDRRLVAYVVGAPGASLPPVADLRSALKTTLPEYMLPSAIVVLEAIPLTANGKIDRKMLPPPDASAQVGRTSSRPPGTYTEGLLGDIWAELFQIESVGAEDDFFELGGHSLLAVQLMNRVKQVFGKQLPLNAVFESPTLESLAKRIEDDRSKLGLHSLVSVRAVGTRPPIYWVPGGAALGLFSLRGVLTRLSPDQPVFGLGSMPPSTIDEVETVEQRATNYLELIRRHQPRGPYCLAGFCAGGRVAFEMAQQLVADGEEVAFLGLVNCTVPGFPATRAQELRRKVQRLRYQLATARKEGLSPMRYAQRKLRDRANARAERARIEASRREVHERGFDGGDMAHNQVLMNVTVEVFERYKPRPYPGLVSLFISRDDEELAGVSEDLDPRFEWRRLASETAVKTFPGGHLAIVEMPHAVKFADAMQEALDRALASRDAVSRPSTG